MVSLVTMNQKLALICILCGMDCVCVCSCCPNLNSAVWKRSKPSAALTWLLLVWMHHLDLSTHHRYAHPTQTLNHTSSLFIRRLLSHLSQFKQLQQNHIYLLIEFVTGGFPHCFPGARQAVHAHRNHGGVCVRLGGEAGCYQQTLLQWLQTQSWWVTLGSFIKKAKFSESELNIFKWLKTSYPSRTAFWFYLAVYLSVLPIT